MKKVINKIFIYIFMLIIIFISVIPFVYMVMMSFKSTTNAYDFDFSLEKLTLMQYQKIFSLANFPNCCSCWCNSYGNSMFTGRVCICKDGF